MIIVLIKNESHHYPPGQFIGWIYDEQMIYTTHIND